VILQDGQSRLRLQLLVVEGHQIGLRFLDFEVHLLGQLLHILDLLELFLVDLDHAFLLFDLCLFLQLRNFIIQQQLASLILLVLAEIAIQVDLGAFKLEQLFLVLFLLGSVVLGKPDLLRRIVLHCLSRHVL